VRSACSAVRGDKGHPAADSAWTIRLNGVHAQRHRTASDKLLMKLGLIAACMATILVSWPRQDAVGQSAGGESASPANPCTDIDFMAGTWEVRDADGTVDASVKITLHPGHCSSTELWSFTKAFGGAHTTCLMVYENRSHDWARLCSGLGNGDRYRSSKGKLTDDGLRFIHDDNATVDGVTEGLVLANMPDHRIHELITQSTDGGHSWKTIDDTYYSRKN
jgi:hypothetical protein